MRSIFFPRKVSNGLCTINNNNNNNPTLTCISGFDRQSGRFSYLLGSILVLLSGLVLRGAEGCGFKKKKNIRIKKYTPIVVISV